MCIRDSIEPQFRQPALYFAALASGDDQSLELIKLLVRNGANINFKDRNEQNILFYICRDGTHALTQGSPNAQSCFSATAWVWTKQTSTDRLPCSMLSVRIESRSLTPTRPQVLFQEGRKSKPRRHTCQAESYFLRSQKRTPGNGKNSHRERSRRHSSRLPWKKRDGIRQEGQISRTDLVFDDWVQEGERDREEQRPESRAASLKEEQKKRGLSERL